MPLQPIHVLLDVGVTLVGGACLLRVWMRWCGVALGHPVGQLACKLSDWLVQPLQQLLPGGGRIDAASLLATWLLKLLQYVVLIVLSASPSWSALPLLALLGVAKLALSVLTALIVLAAILSWAGQRTLVSDAIDRLCAPLLAPVRRWLPLLGGLDLSPVVVLLGLQALALALGVLQVGLSLPSPAL